MRVFVDALEKVCVATVCARLSSDDLQIILAYSK